MPRRFCPTKREVEDADLLVEILAIHSASSGTYGSPRVYKQLLRDEHEVSEKRVANLMRKVDLRGRVRRRFRTKADS